MTPSGNIVNAMTVDVEDYFQVSAFEDHIPRSRWDQVTSRVERNTDRTLELLHAHDVKATFFVLGWVAERYPALLRRIHDAGHEIASHGFSHVRATTQDPKEFERDVTHTKRILEDICGVEVTGFRAASFSIGRENLWALGVLRDAGYHYSSSIYPVHHDLYGMPEAPRFPFRNGDGGVLEIPISTVPIGKYNLPCGGGGYFRLLPYAYFKWAIGRINTRDGVPAVFYFHPWEIDPGQPRVPGIGVKARFRHYTNLARMQHRLRRLLADFAWGRMDRIFADGATAAGMPDRGRQRL